MSAPLGIGIITYNRKQVLRETIERVRRYTRHPDTVLVVADDGSTDGTAEMLLDLGIPVIAGANRGVAWNKNRALFFLSRVAGCGTVILLEDDTRPDGPGWEADWIKAADRWGHINVYVPWMGDMPESGAGSADDPFLCKQVSAQCAAWSRDALNYAGFFDTRFRGFGHEHVEQSARMVRNGYGGRMDEAAETPRTLFYLMKGAFQWPATQTHGNPALLEQNVAMLDEVFADRGYRTAWRDETEMQAFRREMNIPWPTLKSATGAAGSIASSNRRMPAAAASAPATPGVVQAGGPPPIRSQPVDRIDIGFGRDGNAAQATGEGWLTEENGFSWACGDRCRLTISIPATTADAWFEIDACPIVTPQILLLWVGGALVHVFQLTSRRNYGCTIPGHMMIGRDRLEIVIEHPGVPMQSASDVHRAVCFFRLSLVFDRGR